MNVQHRSWQGQLVRRVRNNAVLLGLPLWLATNVFTPVAYSAVNNNDMVGQNAVIRVRGALTESACRLDMSSNWQDVRLGKIGTGRLKNVGDQGTPVTIRLILRDCFREKDYQIGGLLVSAIHPALSLSFFAPNDTDNPELIKLQGVSGLALRLRDENRNSVILGHKINPLRLKPGQHELIYTVVAERTKSELVVGDYSAQVNVRLNYD